MKPRFLRPLCALVAVCLAAPAAANEFVRLDLNLFLTSEHYLQTVIIELYDDRPLTRDNFLQYVDGDHYDGTIFHRLVPGFVLQGGGFYESFQAEPVPINFSLNSNARVDLDGDPNTANPTVDNEFGNSPARSNLTGTLAMAKTAAGPDSATNQFFFNLADNSANLDNQNGGFTVFAGVVGSGMTLVNALTNISQFSAIQLDNYNQDLVTENVLGQVTALIPDGVEDFGNHQFAGPFTSVPVLDLVIGKSLSDVRLRIESAERTGYYATGTVTQVPEENLVITADSIIDTGAAFLGVGAGTGRVVLDAGVELETFDGASIDAGFLNNGRLMPGVQTGVLTVDSFEQSASGVTQLQLGNNVEGFYDMVISEADAVLAGGLEIELLNVYLPTLGHSFTLFEAQGTIVGGFDSIDLPDLPQGLAWDYQASSQAITLDIVAPDFNGDGTVDTADFTVWRDALDSGSLDADANGDEVVDITDYQIWRRLFGATVSTGSLSSPVATPEPAAATLLLLVGLGLGQASARRASV